MENKEAIYTVKGTHPLFTMLFFSVIIAVLVASGSYVSKQKSVARELSADLGSAVTFLSTER
jgi:hypothetical protein